METLVMIGVRSLGRVIALHFAAHKWRVVCASRTRDDVERLARDVDAAGGQGVPVVCDLTDRASLAALVGGQERIDLCVAAQTAGGRFGAKPLIELDDEELERGYNVYLRGTWNLLKAVGPKMLAQGQGTFLQIGTSSGVRTRDGFAALGAVQHGLRALVQVAAREWRGQGVHVGYLPIDGGIAADGGGGRGADRANSKGEIARACEYLHRQERSAWTHELLLRPPATDWTAPT
jgi:NAD(P)-dependent dehydrogenase (short-subunit alcohol dehydrogenase family)